jgi:transcriptional regulator with XRE-family HTH domain
LRTRRGWTQADLAEASETTARTVQRIEANKPVSIDSLRAVASALEVAVAEVQIAEPPPAAQSAPKQGQEPAGIEQILRERQILESKIDILCQYWSERAPGWRSFEGDRRKVERWIHDFGEDGVMRSMDTCGRQYLDFWPNGRAVPETAFHAFSMIPRVCRVQQASPEDQDLYLIRGFARNRMDGFDDHVALRLLKAARVAGASIEKLRAFASSVHKWEDFKEGLALLAENPCTEAMVSDSPLKYPSPEVIQLLGLDSSGPIKQSLGLVAAAKQLTSPEQAAEEILKRASAAGELVLTIDSDRQSYYLGRTRDGGGRTFAIGNPWTASCLAEAIKSGFRFSLA